MSDDAPRSIEKKVDERWKDEVTREKQKFTGASTTPPPAGAPSSPSRPASPPPAQPPPAAAPPTNAAPDERDASEPNFAVFLSSLSMQAMMALGELPLPGTDARHEDLDQARYLIDILGMLQEKTRNHLTAEEGQFLENALYELRLRYTQKLQPPMPPPPGGRR